jgi:hypothetical protein
MICIYTCGMYLRVLEGSIWRLLSGQVGRYYGAEKEETKMGVGYTQTTKVTYPWY